MKGRRDVHGLRDRAKFDSHFAHRPDVEILISQTKKTSRGARFLIEKNKSWCEKDVERLRKVEDFYHQVHTGNCPGQQRVGY